LVYINSISKRSGKQKHSTLLPMSKLLWMNMNITCFWIRPSTRSKSWMIWSVC